MPGESVQAAAQGTGTQAEPGELSELRRQSRGPERSRQLASICRTEHQGGGSYTECDLWRGLPFRIQQSADQQVCDATT